MQHIEEMKRWRNLSSCLYLGIGHGGLQWIGDKRETHKNNRFCSSRQAAVTRGVTELVSFAISAEHPRPTTPQTRFL